MVRPSLAVGLASNMRRVVPNGSDAEVGQLCREAFGAYGRYWAESFRIPQLTPQQLDEGFEVEGYEHLEAALATGLGPIMVVPHLGGWEWAAAWLGRVDNSAVTVVVEDLKPTDVFEWFRDLRKSFGVSVVPLGASALGQLLSAIRRGEIVCLLADRDIDKSGVGVEFFGERTTLPSGPALLARRTGSVILPTAVYFKGDKRLCRIEPPITIDPNTRLRDAVVETTQLVANALERLIRAEPGQWHVLQANWPVT